MWQWFTPSIYGDFGMVYLVGGIATPLKNMKVKWDDDIPQSSWENTSHVPGKPPTSYITIPLNPIKPPFSIVFPSKIENLPVKSH